MDTSRCGFGAEPYPGRSTRYAVPYLASCAADGWKYRDETPIPCTSTNGRPSLGAPSTGGKRRVTTARSSYRTRLVKYCASPSLLVGKSDSGRVLMLRRTIPQVWTHQNRGMAY